MFVTQAPTAPTHMQRFLSTSRKSSDNNRDQLIDQSSEILATEIMLTISGKPAYVL